MGQFGSAKAIPRPTKGAKASGKRKTARHDGRFWIEDELVDSGTLAKLTGSECPVLVVLRRSVEGTDGRVCVSQSRIATLAGVSVRTVGRAIAGLRAKGLLSGGQDKPHRTGVYYVAEPPCLRPDGGPKADKNDRSEGQE